MIKLYHVFVFRDKSEMNEIVLFLQKYFRIIFSFQ